MHGNHTVARNRLQLVNAMISPAAPRDSRFSRMARQSTTPQVVEANRVNQDSRATSGAGRRDPRKRGGSRRHSNDVRPFLKWAGGKRQLLPQIRQFYPGAFGSYIEPFVGSGAVFFDLYNRGLLAGRKAVLIDNNADLVGCYVMVRDRVGTLIRHLTKLAHGYRQDPQAHYYTTRDKRFNAERRRIFNGDGPKSSRYTPALAAKLIYLNRTGFNGLFRLNSHGRFNVPIGRYTNPQICHGENLQRVAEALTETRADICQAPFEAVLESAQPGDFVYFDPPYAPLSRTDLAPETVPARTIDFGRNDQEARCQGSATAQNRSSRSSGRPR